ncbi:MAG: THUMP domain-containing protein, partial [Calditrichota bacterium]
VEFQGDTTLMYRGNLGLRTARGRLKPIHQFQARTDKAFYSQIRQIDWGQYLSPGDTLAVDSVVNSKFFTHSKYSALRVKDAIVDQFRDRSGKRPSVNVNNPSLQINLYVTGDRCVISLDSSGDSLHRRGYRLEGGVAPLNEALAAGLVLLSEWDRQSAFIDPMCGSGTILIEAALFARNIAPGLIRGSFGFQRWPDYDPHLWERLVEQARHNVTDWDGTIAGSDSDAAALDIARENIVRAGLDDLIRLSHASFEERSPSTERGLLVMNPPYGERMKKSDIFNFYHRIGDTLKQNYTGHVAWILSANKEALKHVGLRTSRRYTLYNGPLECKFHRYDLY